MKKSLFEEVRSEKNIYAAWRHVSSSARHSENKDIRSEALLFESNHQRHLKTIISQLREDRFHFKPVKGVLADKKKRLQKGKDPRPIAVAPLSNRVVQRALLQVLQPRNVGQLDSGATDATLVCDPRLGVINAINRSPYGVGGLIKPYGGVRPAIASIMGAMSQGAKYFFQTDIKAFFTGIETGRVVDFVRTETQDDKFSNLFEAALEVRLENEDELKGYSSLFPKGGIGVAQGSSLSAFCGNVLLYELDRELNSMGVTSIRYIDDILMVSGDVFALEKAMQHAKGTLTGMGLGIYDVSDGSGKAAMGECANSINFLGCTLQPNRCVPSAESIKSVKSSIQQSFSTSKAAIKRLVDSGASLPLGCSVGEVLGRSGKRLYGWQKAFIFCTDMQPFSALDSSIAAMTNDYVQSVNRILKNATEMQRMEAMGLRPTASMPLLPHTP